MDFEVFEFYTQPSFVDYLNAGWGISVVGAIDYTASNLEQTRHDSLHYFRKHGHNQYETAIEQVIQTLEPYNREKVYQCFGFGGIPHHIGEKAVSHCFALNGDPSNPAIVGLENVLETYRRTLPQIEFGGPTLFGPVLEQFYEYVLSVKDNMVFSILLLVTDGAN